MKHYVYLCKVLVTRKRVSLSPRLSHEHSSPCFAVQSAPQSASYAGYKGVSITCDLTSYWSLISRSWARLLSRAPNPCWRRVWSPENWGNASFWSQDNKDTLLRGAAQLNSRLPRWNCNNLFSSWKRKLKVDQQQISPFLYMYIAKQKELSHSVFPTIPNPVQCNLLLISHSVF